MGTFGIPDGRPSRYRLVAVMAVLVMVAPAQAAMATSGSAVAPGKATPDKGTLVAAEQSRSATAAQALSLGSGEKLVVKDVITDADGSTHVRYDRTFNGLRVIGGDFVSHRDKTGAVKDVSWNTSQKVAVASTTPKVALASAKAAGARNASSVQKTTAAASTGEKVVYAGGATPKLAYDVLTEGVQADQTPSRLHTIVDAETGATLVTFDEIHTGTGHGIYSGEVNIGTTTAGPPFSMHDAAGNYTTDLGGIEDEEGKVPGTTFTDDDDSWGNGLVTDRASAAVDAQYGAEKTFEYFNTMGRNGIWGNGVGVRSRVHHGDNYSNAFWHRGQMTYGDGAGNASPLVALDIVAHEMSHGITENTADLVYAGESGGLNEATSDIFGTAVEWYANNAVDTPDYLLGEKVNINGNGTPLRYMDKPSKDGRSADCWSPTMTETYDDPHLTSGPLNHWFYLASEGSGPKTINGVAYDSTTCNASTVTGIGRDKAAKIWYRTLSTYLTSSNTYAAAREGAIQSAKDLYGTTSTECTKVAALFSAIAVPPAAQTCGITASPVDSNLLDNPGFESGDRLWSATPKVIARWGSANPSQPAHSGTWSAWLGGYGGNHEDSISQLVTIPVNRKATLSYYRHIDSQERPGSSAYDTLTVRAGSTVLQTLSNRDAASGFRRESVDLSAYAGKTITLSFSGSEDHSAKTSFVLDDLQVIASNALRMSDFNQDGHTDLLARDKAGRLWLYPGNGAGKFLGRKLLGPGWKGMTAIISPGDVTGDDKADILARTAAGQLWLYPGNGAGAYQGRKSMGRGWNTMTAITATGNMTGDARPDVLARDRAGRLWLYPVVGAGVFGSRRLAGVGGWNTMTAITGAGDLCGDGRADVLARDRAGKLWLYRGDGIGRLGSRIPDPAGARWNGMTAMLTPGNFDRAGGNDLIARDKAGTLWLYPGNGAGRFGSRRLVGAAFRGYTLA